jgi:hypothetical protein
MDPDLLNEGSALPFLAADHAGLINAMPTTFGQLNGDGMFPAKGLATPFVRIDKKGGVLRALPITQGGRPSTIARHKPGSGVILEIPNISHEDSILAVDIRNWLALAARYQNPPETLTGSVEDRHRENRLKFDITLEVMKMGALKGEIRDGENTLLYNLYKEFDYTQRVVELELNDPDFDVPEAIEAILGGTEDALINDTMTGVEIRASTKLYNKILGHRSVKEYYANTPAMLSLINNQRENINGSFRRRINIAGLEMKEYRGKVQLWGADDDAPLTALIDDGEGHAYPTGTFNSQATYAAPPLDIRTLDGNAASVNDLIHFSEEPMKHGGGLDWKYQMNALPVWQKPDLLTKVVFVP